MTDDSFFDENGAEVDIPEGRGYRWLPLAALAGAVLTVLGMVLLWPKSAAVADLGNLQLAAAAVQAEVVSLEQGPCPGTAADEGVECRLVGFRILDGRDRGDIFVQGFGDERSAPTVEVGDTVILYDHGGRGRPAVRYQYADRERRSVLVWVAIAFAAAVVALGRWRGVAALGALAASLVVLLLFVLPAILSGRSPAMVAVVGAAAIAYLALYLAHGIKPLTHVALLGTLGALGLTVVLSAVVTGAADISGFASEDALFLTQAGIEIDLRGLVLAGIVLGALGALDDVTVTQASAVWQLHRANPSLDSASLTSSGLAVGRDHIASTVNTLLLAYAGAALPLLILFVLSDLSLGIIANSEIVAVEIIRTLVGSIGLVAAVPLTTWLAAQVAVLGVSRQR
jgi:uncharacterized membrane protein